MSMTKNVVMAACVVFATMTASVVQAESLSAEEIAQRYEEEVRRLQSMLTTKFRLSTCRYTVENAQMRCADRPRVREVENVAKAYGRDIRSLAVISEPISDRGISMLGYQYWDPNRINDNWLYLPALNRVRRVVATRDSRDSGSYFGTEFFIEDLEDPRLEDYTYRLLDDETVRVQEDGKEPVDVPAYVVEWTPTAQRAKTTNYGKSVIWVDKERFILLKGEYYDVNGNLFKRRTVRNLQLLNGSFWIPRQVTMDNLDNRRVTVMERLAIVIGHDIEDEYLTQRSLTDVPFRERYLREIRQIWDR